MHDSSVEADGTAMDELLHLADLYLGEPSFQHRGFGFGFKGLRSILNPVSIYNMWKETEEHRAQLRQLRRQLDEHKQLMCKRGICSCAEPSRGAMDYAVRTRILEVCWSRLLYLCKKGDLSVPDRQLPNRKRVPYRSFLQFYREYREYQRLNPSTASRYSFLRILDLLPLHYCCLATALCHRPVHPHSTRRSDLLQSTSATSPDYAGFWRTIGFKLVRRRNCTTSGLSVKARSALPLEKRKIALNSTEPVQEKERWNLREVERLCEEVVDKSEVEAARGKKGKLRRRRMRRWR